MTLELIIFRPMPRTARKAPGGMIFHVLNRRVGRQQIFHKDEDFAAFERVLAHAIHEVPVGLLAYCLMPNHWHLLLSPSGDADLGRFMQRLTITHTRRWKEHYHEVGTGHLYQGRFKSFPVQDDAHFLKVARYIEPNPLRANLVARAEDWRWSSLWRRLGHGGDTSRPPLPMTTWPVEQKSDWISWVNKPQNNTELEALRVSVNKGKPFGDQAWQDSVTRALGLESSYRKAGRPKKHERARP
jgi:putative transposase